MLASKILSSCVVVVALFCNSKSLNFFSLDDTEIILFPYDVSLISLSHLMYENLLQPLNSPQSRYAEPDNRDWRGRSAQFPASGEERSWESLRESREFGNRTDSRQQEPNQFNRQDQPNSHFAKASNEGVMYIPVILFYNFFELLMIL